MTDFLKDCYFNDFCKGRKNFVPTPSYEKKLRAIWHSAELRLLAMRHSAESIFLFKKIFICDSAPCNSMWNSSQKFSCWLRAMPHSGESRLHAMEHSAELWLPAVGHSVDLIFVIEYLCKFKSICITVLAHESGDPGVQFNRKTEGKKSCENVSLRECYPTNISRWLYHGFLFDRSWIRKSCRDEKIINI
jgi:hypothetical protein